MGTGGLCRAGGQEGPPGLSCGCGALGPTGIRVGAAGGPGEGTAPIEWTLEWGEPGPVCQEEPQRSPSVALAPAKVSQPREGSLTGFWRPLLQSGTSQGSAA